MCMEDVRIGRKTTTITTQVDVPISSQTVVAKQRPDRVAIRFRWGSNVGTHLFPWTDATPPTAFTLGNAGGFTESYDIQHHGDMVCQPWWIVVGAGQCMCYVTEVFLADR
jgi:hypothetical protein